MKNKGGRPKVKNPKNIQLAAICTTFEAYFIRQRAKVCNLSVSEYLRKCGLEQNVEDNKPLPVEILKAFGDINNCRALLNQIAKKSNSNILLNNGDVVSFNDTIDGLNKTIKAINENYKK